MKKPVVGVIGIRPTDLQVLRLKVPEVQLEMIDKRRGVKVPSNIEIIFIMTRFLDHARESRLRGELRKVRGGISTLINVLKEYLKERKACHVQSN